MGDYVRNLMAKYMMKHVTTMPPIRMYLSPSDLRSMSLMTVFDMPSMEATSNIFLRIPLSILLWSRKLSNIVLP